MTELVQMTEEQFQERLNVTYYSGRASAYEDIASFFRARAGELYAVDKETEAASMKRLVPEMLKFAEAHRKTQAACQKRLDEMENPK